jgi:HAE1 family hydrophobic/amphiphilic exporter-1
MFFSKNFGAATSAVDTGAEEMGGMMKTAGALVGGVLVLLYLVMGAQFESFLLPLVFLLSLVPAFSGAFGCLVITGKSLNMNSVIALVILFGIAVNNGIIFYEACALGGEVIERCAGKMRAIVVTAGTTVCAMVPFAVGESAQASLAVVLTGGRVVSTVVVVLVVPVILVGYFKHGGHRG